MDVIRTPDERFENLSGYPFAKNYTEVPDTEGGSLRIHHVDEGSRDAEPVLCLHGQPTWSFLYRNMIPIFVDAGMRVVAPDFVGFGRSDKPTSVDDYTYARHVQWMSCWLEALDLQNINLFCQDWGGLIGLRLVAAYPERFARVVVANTGLPDGTGVPEQAGPAMRKLYESLPVVTPGELMPLFRKKDGPPGFMYWRKMCAEAPSLKISDLVSAAGGFPKETMAGYDAPFPDDRYMQGARKFPSLVPIFPDDPEIPANRKAWEVLAAFDKPLLTAFSDGDPVTAGGEKIFQERVAGAKGQQHVTINGAGHFLQEEKAAECAAVLLELCRANPLSKSNS